MSVINCGLPNGGLYKIAPEKVFNKNDVLDIPANIAVTIWQDGKPVECVVGPKQVKLNKKDIKDLKCGLFSSKVECELTMAISKHDIFRRLYIQTPFKNFKGSPAMEAMLSLCKYTMCLEYIVKGTNSLKIKPFGEGVLKYSKQKDGIALTVKGVENVIDLYVNDYFIANYLKDFYNPDIMVEKLESQDEEFKKFLSNMEKNIELRFASEVGYSGKVRIIGIKDPLTL